MTISASKYFHVITAIITISAFFLNSSITSAENATPDVDINNDSPPKITDVQMKIVPYSIWTLIVRGNNFGTNQGSILLNNVNREITLWNNQEINAEVPSGTNGEKLKLTTSSGQTVEINFSLNISATVTSFSPIFPYPGANITLNGYEFEETKGQIYIDNNSVPSSAINSWTEYQIKFQIPDLTPLGTAYLKVKTSQDEYSEIIEFPINERPAPEIGSVVPSSGLSEDLITIYGNYFGTEKGDLTLNDLPLETKSWQDHSITFLVPESAKSGNLAIIVANKKSNKIPFTITKLPVITSVSPLSITPGKTKVEIRGSGFKDAWYVGSNIYFNGIVTELILEWSDEKIVAIPPKNITSGEISLKIVNIGTLIKGPSYQVKSEIAYISPEAAKAGESVEIYGNNFGEQTGSVLLENLSCEILSWENSKIQIRIPEKARSGTLKIQKADGSLIQDFDFNVLESISDDPFSHLQWYLNKTKAVDAWPLTAKGEVVIAVIDDGVDTNHPDLTKQIWGNKNEIPGNSLDDDQNGYIDDNRGWNFIKNENELTPAGPHGTMVAGIIAATANNKIGIRGIAEHIKIMPLIACDDRECPSRKVSEAIRYSADNGASIINLSLGGAHFTNTYSDEYNDAITYAFSKKVLIISAAGNGDLISNEGRNLNVNPTSPACNDGTQNMVIGVAALDKTDKKTNWSDYGSNCVDISAPGVNIFTSVPPAFDPNYNPQDDITKYGYDYGNGTSFAAPQVSATAALLKSLHPTWSPFAIAKTLISSADDINKENPNFVNQLGGRLNILNALKGEKPSVDETISDETLSNISSGRFSNLRASEVRDGKFQLIWDIPSNLNEISHYLISVKTNIADQWQTFSDKKNQPIQYPKNSGKVEISVKYQLKYTYRVEMIDNKGKTRGTLILEVNLKPIPTEFPDVATNHINRTAINFLKNRRILEGYPDGNFQPDAVLNRAELLKLLILSRGINPDYDKYRSCFPDVQEEWFARFICYAKDQQWISGYPDGTFRPAQEVNRSEAIKMLANIFGLLLPYPVPENPYQDVEKNLWYAPYISVAKTKNILAETGPLYNPAGPMLRSAISENIYRALVIRELNAERYQKGLDKDIKVITN